MEIECFPWEGVMMKTHYILRSPEREGDSLKGGGHPAEKRVSKEDEIDEMTGRAVGSHGKTPGMAEAGVEGTAGEGPERTKSAGYSGSTPPP